MTYMDQTWCTFWKQCQGGPRCWRALTSAEKARAERLGLPVSQFVGHPGCFKEKRQGQEVYELSARQQRALDLLPMPHKDWAATVHGRTRSCLVKKNLVYADTKGVVHRVGDE